LAEKAVRILIFYGSRFIAIKYLFDRLVAEFGLLFLWPMLSIEVMNLDHWRVFVDREVTKNEKSVNK